MLNDLKKIKQLYEDDVNIIDYIKSESNADKNTSEMINISYDLQAGSYIKKHSDNPEWEAQVCRAYVNVMDQLKDCQSILEVGVGEATTFCNVLMNLSKKPKNAYGFDISYSRIKYAMQHFKASDVQNSTLFMGDLFNAAIQDDSIDLVYTSHSLESNGGKEREALSELYRMTRKYLVLFEPSYELASDASRKHMEKYGYVKNLHKTASDLGYKVIDHKLVFESNPHSLNNTAVIVIEKDSSNKPEILNPLACPVTKAPLELIRNNYYCKESLLLYPIVEHVPCLSADNAIIATHYLDEI